jgi:hypothetical protein
MPITQAQIQAAESEQHAAAHDPCSHTRVVAGPGTGKSFVIEERVRWLLYRSRVHRLLTFVAEYNPTAPGRVNRRQPEFA